MNMNTMGTRFKWARSDLGLTQSELAERAKMDRVTYISEIERGIARPTIDTFTELVRAMSAGSERDEQGLAHWILYGVDTSEELDRAEEECNKMKAQKDAEIVRLHQQLDATNTRLQRLQADKPPQYAELIDAFMSMPMHRRIELVLLARLLGQMDSVINNSVELDSIVNSASGSGGFDIDSYINAAIDQRLGRAAVAAG